MTKRRPTRAPWAWSNPTGRQRKPYRRPSPRQERLRRTLQLNPEVTEGVLHITARAAACDGAEGEEIPMHAACHLYQQDWGIPVRLEAGAQDELTLDLRGVR